MDKIGGQPGGHVHKVSARPHQDSSSTTGPVLVWIQDQKSSVLEICLFQVPALGAQEDATPRNGSLLCGKWETGSPRGSFEIRMVLQEMSTDRRRKLEKLVCTCGNQGHQGTQQHYSWQLREGTEKTP